jgi:hypothetical protein
MRSWMNDSFTITGGGIGRLGIFHQAPTTLARDPQSKENGFPIGGPFNAFAEGSVPRGHRLPKAQK